MRHCRYCSREYSDKYFRKHSRSNKQIKKAFEVKYIYKTQNVLVNEIDDALSNIINKHKRKFHSILIVCKINNKKIMGYPKRVLLKYYDKDGKINVDCNFYSNRKDMTFNHYISQPKPMLETLLIKNLDKYPEKLKILEYSKAPYHEYLILNYYGFGIISHGNPLVFCVRVDWLNNAPAEADNNFKEILVVVVVVVEHLIPVERIIGENKKSNNSRPTGFTKTFDKIGARVINIKSRLGFER